MLFGGGSRTFLSSTPHLPPLAVATALWLWACTPRTDLAAQNKPGPVPAAPVLTSVTLLEPASGTVAVPMNLSAMTLGFPAPVIASEVGARISLADTPGAILVSLGVSESADCSGKPSSNCVRISVVGVLLPSAAYEVRLAAGLVDGSGRGIPAGSVGHFMTAGWPDLVAPTITGFGVEPSGPCVLAHFETDEPAAGRVVIRVDGTEREIPAGTLGSRFSAAVNLLGGPVGSLVEIFARASDLAGNVGESPPVEWGPLALGLPVAITEIRANPAGPEPAQEFVELKNLGADTVDLEGLTLEDDKGFDALPAASMSSGEYVLVVPSGFDPANPLDTPPVAGTQLLRVDSRLGADGLSNAGEAVRLKGRDGVVISSYGSATPVSAAAWSGKSIHRIPENACDQPATWSQRPLPSTPGWGPPP